MYLRIRKVRYRTATQVGCSPQVRHKVNSSMLSVNCEKAEKATQRYPDCRSPYFAAVAGLWSAPGYLRERGDSQKGGNRRCLPSCAPARRQRRFPRFASAPLPMSISSRLTNTRQKRGILILPAGMAELADAPDLGSGVLDVQVQVLLPAPAKKNAVESLHSVFLLPIFTWTACSVPSAQSAPSLR